jgi:hypothetical protein
MDDKDASIESTMPAQLPKGVSEEDVLRQATITRYAITAILIAQILSQLAIKGSMDYTWSLYNAL